MKSAKIRLSGEEQLLVCNGDWILTKNRVLDQVSSFLADLQEEQADWIREKAPILPGSVLDVSAKVSKGEQYLGLPYRVLDFPRCFGPSAIFAIRTFFWWGHYFSVTLHLAGHWKKETENSLISSFSAIKDENLYICTGTDPWQHHFTDDYYLPIRSLNHVTWEKIILEQPFIKLSTRQELTAWEQMGERLLSDFGRLIRATGYAG